jgi:glutamate racemase
MSQRNDRPIGVFDSGVGGLTVVRALTSTLPNENIVYFGDTARVPYGSKSASVVREYAAQDTDILLTHDPKMIVVACNTVSSVALEIVQKRSNVPVVGVIHPGAVAASKTTKNKRVGIIGTRGTITSRAYEHSLRGIDDRIEVVGQACPLFVPLIEEGWEDHLVTETVAKEYLHPLMMATVDTLVLACTHYPLLKPLLQRLMGPSVTLVDSGEAAAQEVSELLRQSGLQNPSPLSPNIQFIVSDIPLKFSEIGERFLGRTMGRVRTVGL